jgi:hypothetical protein
VTVFDRPLEDLPRPHPYFPDIDVLAGGVEASQDFQEFGAGDGADGLVAQIVIEVQFERAQGVGDVARAQVMATMPVIFGGRPKAEAVDGDVFRFTRILSGAEQGLGFGEPLPRVGQRNVGVRAEAERVLFAAVSIGDPPEFDASGQDVKIESAAVEELAGLIARRYAPTMRIFELVCRHQSLPSFRYLQFYLPIQCAE